MNRTKTLLLTLLVLLPLTAWGVTSRVFSPSGLGELAFTAESQPGTVPTATGTDAIGIGDGAVAGNDVGDNAVIAIGARSTATGADSVAIGENADATGANSIAIGGNSTDATSADATAADAIAIGSNSLADGAQGVAIGVRADAGGAAAVAISDTANASGLSAVAIGENSDATGNNSVAIGGSSVDASSADATNTNAVAIGGNSLASDVDSVGLGASAVGSGNSSLAIGANSTASANRSIAIGRQTNASGANCIAIGGNLTTTDSADCSAADSVAIGQHILADDIGEFAFASGEFATQSDAHTSIFVLRNSTTDTTQTELFADGSAGDISVPSDCTVSFRINVVARQTDADGVSAGYLVIGVIDNNAGTTALVGSVTTTTVGEDVAGWDVTATADDTNDGINVLVTGAVGDAVRWVARAEIVEVCG